MILRISLKKLIRTPVKSILFLILLTMSGTLLCLSVSLFISARESISKADQVFTTIAVPNVVKIREDAGGANAWVVDGNNTYTSDRFSDINRMENELYNMVIQKGLESRVAKKDTRSGYYAFSKELTPLISGSLDPKKAIDDLDFPYNVSAFVAVCESIEEISPLMIGNTPETKAKVHKVIWRIEEAISLHPSYEIPKTLEATTYIQGIANGVPIESGKRYIIVGNLSNPKLIASNDDNTSDVISKNSLPTYFYFFYAYEDEDGSYSNGYFIPYSEMDKEESKETFLRSDEGVKFQHIIENCSSILHSAFAMTTDNLNSILTFNQKKAYIVKGREIQQAEYEQGKQVCIISSQYAEFNGIDLEDDISLSFSPASYTKRMNRDNTVWQFYVDPYTIKYSQEQSYKVVGIYQTPEWELSEYMLSPNSIIIPSKSINNRGMNQNEANMLYENYDPPILNSFIIPNDKLEDFKLEMQEQNIGEYFLYYDQGYSIISDVIESISQNATVSLIYCFFVWLAVLIIFILIFVFHQKHDVGIILTLGAGIRRGFTYIILTCLMLILPATLVSASLGSLLESKISQTSYEMALERSDFNESFSDISSADQGYNLYNKKMIWGGNFVMVSR